jgi:hypothetical protein
MITIGYSTRETKPEFYEYLKKSSGIHKIQVIEKVNNGDNSLSQVYNEIIDESNYDIIVLCHDDIYFDTNNWGKKLLKNFQNNDFGIIGLAGTTNIPVSGRWWEDMSKMSGIVNHEHDGRKWESKYSNSLINSLQEVCLVDGVFISINKKKINNKFNESVKGFHFYDVYFSVENHLSGVKIGVTHDVRLTHKSIGQTNEKWEKNRVEFVEKFKDILPINLIPNIDYNQIKYDKPKKHYNLVLQTTSDLKLTEKFINNIKSIGVFEDVNFILISNENNYEDLKGIESENIKVFEGFFNSINKNLSVLKWDDNFINFIKEDLIFFSIDSAILLSNIFGSMYKVYQKEKNILSVIFPSILNSDYTIFSNGLEILKNQEQKLNVYFRGQLTNYNILQGHQPVYFGNISPLFATTYSVLSKNDWFDIDFESDLFSLNFCMKTNLKSLKSFVDTNSIVKKEINYFSDQLINQEFQKIMYFASQNSELNSKFKIIK